MTIPKTALVTGAAQRIGRVIAEDLAAAGWLVVVHYNRSAEAADYSIAWIDKLEQLAEQWTGWRSQTEKDHVYGQFEEAREVYRAFKAEAVGGR